MLKRRLVVNTISRNNWNGLRNTMESMVSNMQSMNIPICPNKSSRSIFPVVALTLPTWKWRQQRNHWSTHMDHFHKTLIGDKRHDWPESDNKVHAVRVGHLPLPVLLNHCTQSKNINQLNCLNKNWLIVPTIDMIRPINAMDVAQDTQPKHSNIWSEPVWLKRGTIHTTCE